MKIFTRSIYFLALSILCMPAVAQYDIAVTSVATVATSGGAVPPNSPIFLSIGIENVGADIPDQTTFNVVALNGTDTVAIGNWFFDGVYSTGATGFVQSAIFTLPAAPPNVSLCGVIILHIPDDDSTNNFMCEPYTVSTSANTDLKTTHVFINQPNDLDSFDIDGGDEDPDPITDVSIIFKNVGNTNIPAGFGIPYEYEFNGNLAANCCTGTITAELTPGDSTIRPSVDPGFTVPTEVGTYELCGRHTLDDNDPSNDELCVSFTLIDTYVPPPPVGINDQLQSDINIFYSNKQIWVKGVTAPLELTVTDAQGRVVVSERMIEDGNIQMHDAPAGVYIIRSVNTENGKSTMQKVSAL